MSNQWPFSFFKDICCISSVLATISENKIKTKMSHLVRLVGVFFQLS